MTKSDIVYISPINREHNEGTNHGYCTHPHLEKMKAAIADSSNEQLLSSLAQYITDRNRAEVFSSHWVEMSAVVTLIEAEILSRMVVSN